MGGNLEMLRKGAWASYARSMVWLSFDTLQVVHRVTTVTFGTRYSVTLYTPSQLEHLTADDWASLGRFGFPIYLYNPESLRMRPLKLVEPCAPATQSSKVVNLPWSQEQNKDDTQANNATSSKDLEGGDDPLQNIPLPSIADVEEQQVLDPKPCRSVVDVLDLSIRSTVFWLEQDRWG